MTAAISKSQDDADEVTRRAKEALGEVAFTDHSRICRTVRRTPSRAVRRREGVLPARAARLLLGEAVAAVDGPVLARFEGDLAR